MLKCGIRLLQRVLSEEQWRHLAQLPLPLLLLFLLHTIQYVVPGLPLVLASLSHRKTQMHNAEQGCPSLALVANPSLQPPYRHIESDFDTCQSNQQHAPAAFLRFRHILLSRALQTQVVAFESLLSACGWGITGEGVASTLQLAVP
jgi:hypothetical protein